MADIYKRQSAYLGAVTLSGTTAVDSEVLPVLATPLVLRRAFFNVTTGVTVAPGTITFQWRPTPGTGTFVTLGVVTIPIAAADSQFEYNFERADHTDTEVETAYDNPTGDQPPDASPYLIGEQRRDDADGVTLIGPGGEFRILPGGQSTAGVVGVWGEFETRATAGTLPNTNVQPL